MYTSTARLSILVFKLNSAKIIILKYQLLTDNLVLCLFLFIFVIKLFSILHLIITQLQIRVIYKLYQTIPAYH